MRPASRPLRSRTVCRSASTWQGWNSSVSALITGTLDTLASALIRRWAKVRMATASTNRDSTREVSSMVSSRPSWLGAAVDDDRLRAELGDADLEGEPGAGRVLLEHHRDRLAGQRGEAGAVLLELVGEYRAPSSVRRGSGRRPAGSAGRARCVIWFPPRRSSRTAVSRMRGSAATNESACSVVRMSGGASRITSGAGALMMNPASRAARGSPARTIASVSTMPSSSPAPRTCSTSGWPRSSTAVAMCLPSAATWSSRPSVSMVRRTASAAAAQTGLPANVLPCWPGCSRLAASPSRWRRRSAARRPDPWPA